MWMRRWVPAAGIGIVVWLPWLSDGKSCTGGSGRWQVEVPFAEAALWAASLRRLRLIARAAGVKLKGPRPEAYGGESNHDDWGGEDYVMVEPILYSLRSAVLALQGCQESRTQGSCPSFHTTNRMLERFLRLEKHVVTSYDSYRHQVAIIGLNRVYMPRSWSDAFELLTIGGEGEKVLKKLGSTRVELRKRDLNGAPHTCSVSLPPSAGVGDDSLRVELRDGLGSVPLLGFGTGDRFWQSSSLPDSGTLQVGSHYPKVSDKKGWKSHHEACVRAVTWAIDAGYRFFDTAQDYQTQKCVGEAISASGLPRSDVFIATKLSHESDYKAEGIRVRPAFDRQLAELKMTHVDLYLQHSAVDGSTQMQQVWGMMEELQRAGFAKALGAATHSTEQLSSLEKRANKGRKPAIVYRTWDVFHRGFEERALQRLANRTGMHAIAVGVVHGTPYELSCVNDPVVKSIAKRLHRTAGQVCLRFALQNGFGVLVKSRREERIKENAQLFDFEIADSEMQILNSLMYAVRPGWDEIDTVNDALGYSSIHEFAREEL
eukprot:TRINITY_DN20514_c0_g1_i1.p1 TRINITY_DN20514_c0_g1~~TRINITY_DN20514_c0_g1_i1.p1  ORF type:complete len:544 (-),score=76.71 TRINITY_DN20514_c0_g1_i1:277-1908(-)